MGDQDLPAFWQELGVPGGVDIHTHFLPDRMQEKVWSWFDSQVDEHGEGVWPIRYRGKVEERVQTLRGLGLTAWTALAYAHKPGMAAWLNEWTAAFAAQVPECALSATFYPEQGVDGYTAVALEAGTKVFKIHFDVGGFDPADPLLHPVWRRIERAGVPVVIHAGSGPVAGTWNRPEHFRRVLAIAPDLTAVVAHMGMPEYAEFLDLALAHPNVHLDTTMVFTDFTEQTSPYPPELLPRLAENPERIVFGSDFPSIPHAYAHQVAAVARLGLGEEWLRAVLHDNGVRLLCLC